MADFLTSGRDEALNTLLHHLSTLISSTNKIKHEDQNFQRFSSHMLHLHHLLTKLQSQPSTTPLSHPLLKIQSEITKSLQTLNSYNSKSPLLRPFLSPSVIQKLNHSSKQIFNTLHFLPFAQINTALNIKETIQAAESSHLKLSNNYKSVFSTVCPLPIHIEEEKSDFDSYSQLPFSSFFLCPLTGEILVDPVSVFCNHSFERKAIEEHFYSGQNSCPLCNKELSANGELEVASNSTLRNSILEWRKREERISVERNARKRVAEIAAAMNLDDLGRVNRLIGEVYEVMVEVPGCVGAAGERCCKLVSKLAGVLMSGCVENASLVMRCLLLISRFSDENKASYLNSLLSKHMCG